MPKQEQVDLLAQDEVLKNQGDYLAAVQTKVTTVTNWNGLLSHSSSLENYTGFGNVRHGLGDGAGDRFKAF